MVGSVVTAFEAVKGLRRAVVPVGFQHPAEGMPELPAASDCVFYDWNMVRLDPGTDVVTLARPGILFVVAKNGNTSETHIDGSAHFARAFLQTKPECQKYLSSFDATIEARRRAAVDVFLSYASDDTNLAEELHSGLVNASCTVFLAKKSIGAASRWKDEIRSALQTARMLVLLLTPNSVSCQVPSVCKPA